jgi:hypothetical protein
MHRAQRLILHEAAFKRAIPRAAIVLVAVETTALRARYDKAAIRAPEA